MRTRIIAHVAAILFVLPLHAFAQQGTAEIAGRITDEQGGALPGVTITFTDEETGAFREVLTGADGSFSAPQMRPGRYHMVAKLQSFATFERNGLILQIGQTMIVNGTMRVGALTESVEVTAESPLVDTTSAKVGGNIGTDELSELPAMNRNYFATVALVPGVQFAPSNQMVDSGLPPASFASSRPILEEPMSKPKAALASVLA